jgi:hypothetical protein
MWASVADQTAFVLQPWLTGRDAQARAGQQLLARLNAWAAGRSG